MNHASALDTVSTILARAGLVLRDRHDAEGVDLARAVQDLRTRVHFARQHDVPRAAIARIADDTTALHERVVDYAAKHRIRYLTIDTSKTIVMTPSQFPPELRAAIDGMKPGDTTPPPEVAAVLESHVADIGGIDRRETSRIPPPPRLPSILPPTCLDDDSE